VPFGAATSARETCSAATGANGQAVTVSTQVQGVVSGVNLNSNPPTLKVNGQNVQISQVTAISQ
jgi:hypothetical protein